MKYVTFISIAATALALVFLGAGQQGAVIQSGQEPRQQVQGMLPDRLTSLTQLQLLKAEMGSMGRLERLIIWLVEERRRPSETRTGFGGGPITSGYVQEQLVKAMASIGDVKALRWLSEGERVTDAGLRELLRLSLGLAGDRTQQKLMVDLLQNSREPNVRLLAAFGLGTIQAKEAIPLLEQIARKDAYRVEFDGEGGHKVIYPVREQATAAVRTMKNQGGIDWANARLAVYDSEMVFYSTFVAESTRELQRLVSLCRGDEPDAQ